MISAIVLYSAGFTSDEVLEESLDVLLDVSVETGVSGLDTGEEGLSPGVVEESFGLVGPQEASARSEVASTKSSDLFFIFHSFPKQQKRVLLSPMDHGEFVPFSCILI